MIGMIASTNFATVLPMILVWSRFKPVVSGCESESLGPLVTRVICRISGLVSLFGGS